MHEQYISAESWDALTREYVMGTFLLTHDHPHPLMWPELSMGEYDNPHFNTRHRSRICCPACGVAAHCSCCTPGTAVTAQPQADIYATHIRSEECPHCGGYVSDDEPCCPRSGAQTAPARTPKPLFDVADYVPKHHAKKLAKKKKAATTKATAHNAKFDDVTKPVRLPVTWSREELTSRIELLHSALYTAEAELAEARKRSGNKLSNRFEKLAALVRDLRKAWPAGDVYDPFRE